MLVVGTEGTGSFGAELGRYLRANRIAVVEVDRPDPRAHRAAGKSDSIDAYAAATAVLAGRATGTLKHRDGAVEAIRGLRMVRASAVTARTQTINQIKSLIITAPAAGTRSTALTDHHRTGPTAGRQPSWCRSRRPGHSSQNRPQAPGQAVPAPERGDSGGRRAFAREGGHAVGCHAARVSLAVWCRCSYSLGLRWPLAEWRRRVL
ncbi:transposase [Kitasatospora sp. NPDC048540]|uniref:IS110 family transposase n=1 Tax=Kitasatospora sp. NPDC048540 TaxID=3155634 RepID=UPI0033EE9A3C